MDAAEVRLLKTAGAMLPDARPSTGDAGLDLYACEAAIGPGESWSIGTGIAVEIPDGHAGLVLPRSGLALRHGIALVNAPGLIDSGYRGEIRVLLLNTDPAEIFEIEPGDRIAQLLIVPVRAGRAGRGRGPRRHRARRRRLRLERPLAERRAAGADSCAARSSASSSGSSSGRSP